MTVIGEIDGREQVLVDDQVEGRVEPVHHALRHVRRDADAGEIALDGRAIAVRSCSKTS